MSLEHIELIAEFAVFNGYSMQDEVMVVYSYDNVIKRRKMSLSDSLSKLRLKLDKDPRTAGIDFKVIL